MKKALPHILVLLAAVAVYIGAEMYMRRTAYPPPKREAKDEELNRLISNLPTPVGSWIQNRRKVEAMHASIEAETDPEKKAELLYKLVGMVGDTEQYDAYEAIVALIPKSPKAARAWASMLGNDGAAQDVDTYLTYIDGCIIDTPAEELMVWSTGWVVAQGGPPLVRLKYLEKMAEAKMVSSSLVDAYEQMTILANLHGRPDLSTTARTLHQQCLELYRAERDAHR